MFRQSYNQGRRFGQRRPLPLPLNPSLLVKKAAAGQAVVAYVPQHQFADFPLYAQLKANIAQKGYLTPTPIQDQAIPVILEGKDVVGIANTGTGKTAAFLVPLINKIAADRTQRVLVVAPTRELASQIQQECALFTRNMGMGSALVIGGASVGMQLSALARQPRFVIGTPGRLKDLLQSGRFDLGGFGNVVLDEVDRMMDMGFINDITFLIGRLPKERQSLFFSATVPPAVRPLMERFLRNPVTITAKTGDTAETVEQDIIRLNGQNKLEVLHDLLKKQGFDKVLVFGRTKWGVERLSRMLVERGVKAAAIHGNKSLGQRQRALAQFQRGEVTVLFATDVASRGLDIQDVTHVINYDQPASYEDYIHRIGRTGRANKKGMALTFVE